MILSLLLFFGKNPLDGVSRMSLCLRWYTVLGDDCLILLKQFFLHHVVIANVMAAAMMIATVIASTSVMSEMCAVVFRVIGICSLFSMLAVCMFFWLVSPASCLRFLMLRSIF